jgi:hypothetical protein
MTQATVSSTRTVKANGIAASGGIVKLASGGYVAVDVVAGSGLGHITTVDSCDCKDHTYRTAICKHMIAARQSQGVEICATCGARTRYEVHHIGGRGDCGFLVCRQDRTHTARRVD